MKGNDQISPDELWKVANRLQLSGRGSDSITVSDAAEAWGVPEEQVRAALTELRTESDSSTRFAALELENQNLRFLLERAREETTSAVKPNVQTRESSSNWIGLVLFIVMAVIFATLFLNFESRSQKQFDQFRGGGMSYPQPSGPVWQR
ncbi:MAG: hypothetical protein BGO01_08340 [Armatimonadetes bacterium 55-13]|nr:hypothetical protein [Armatimonadota bacterium]OJU62478.1 MAG: hypothetical protein BGO01_08340 [Armatimonadetes bacterium 55-13]